jgi:hypothetical protein
MTIDATTTIVSKGGISKILFHLSENVHVFIGSPPGLMLLARARWQSQDPFQVLFLMHSCIQYMYIYINTYHS